MTSPEPSSGAPEHETPPAAPPATPEQPGKGSDDRVGRTRISATYKGLIAGTLILILLLVFILENTRRVSVSYFGASGHLPLGVALLLAAVAGALIVGIAGSARIFQIRRGRRRSRR